MFGLSSQPELNVRKRQNRSLKCRNNQDRGTMKNESYKEPNDQPTSMNTSTAIINKMVKEGYTENFKVTKQGLYAPSRDRNYQPEEINVTNFYRFEGESDPGDNSILYVIITADGVKGTLLDAYGAYGDKNVTEFMKQVEEINKKNKSKH
jgi:hypothetical protein